MQYTLHFPVVWGSSFKSRTTGGIRKRILNVKSTISNVGVYGELVRYPMYIIYVIYALLLVSFTKDE